MKILFVEPNENTLYSFRKELLDRLIEDGHQVYIILAFGNRIEKDYKDKAAGLFNVDANLKSINLFKNVKLKQTYKKIIKTVKPDILMTYTIKPNLYCNLYSKKCFSIANITGLGTAFNKNGILNKLVIMMYRKSFKNVDHIMFQNKFNYETFRNANIPINKYSIIPGSGVNIGKFKYKPLENHDGCNFLFASRFIKEKGIELLIQAIPCILDKNLNAHFTFIGKDENGYGDLIKKLIKKYPNNINWIPRTNDMLSFYENTDFTVSPSYYNEGISNILLESLAVGRPIITTKDNPGCMEILNNEHNGIGVASNDLNSLIAALNKGLATEKEKIDLISKNGSKFVANNYNRNMVISEYIRIINSL